MATQTKNARKKSATQTGRARARSTPVAADVEARPQASAADGDGADGHPRHQRPGRRRGGLHHQETARGRRPGLGHSQRQRPQENSAGRRGRQPDLSVARHDARPAAAADGAHGHRADLRRREAGAQGRRRALGRSARPGWGPTIAPAWPWCSHGARDSATQAAAPAADVLLAHSRRGRPARCAPRAVEPARQAAAGVQLGRRRGRKNHDRRHRRLSAANRDRRAWPRMPAPRPSRASAPSRSPRWPSPNWCATAGTA